MRLDDAKGALTGAARQQVLSRLNKAVKHARAAVAVLADPVDAGASDSDVVELWAYYYTLAGDADFEKQSRTESKQSSSDARRAEDTASSKSRWHKCLVAYSTARVVYSTLLRSTAREVFKDAIAALDPAIRYAVYQSRLSRSVSVDAVTREYFDKDNGQLVAVLEQLDPDVFSETGPKGEFIECVRPFIVH